jgi:hypothetical protein
MCRRLRWRPWTPYVAARGSTTDSFDRYKDKLLQRVRHYHEVPYVEWFQWVNDPLHYRGSFLPPIAEGPGGRRGTLIVLIERGYLRLAMYFEDERSKNICQHILNVYSEGFAVNNHLKPSALEMTFASRCTTQPGSASGSR